MSVMRTLFLGLVLATSPAAFAGDAHDEPKPYHAERDARADLNMALDAAAENDTLVLLVMGANWCHDSRALAADFETPRFTRLIDSHYELVYVDVGQKNRNIDIANDYGYNAIVGTPTVIILTPEGQVLNRKTAPTWRNAASRNDDESYIYFSDFASGEAAE